MATSLPEHVEINGIGNSVISETVGSTERAKRVSRALHWDVLSSCGAGWRTLTTCSYLLAWFTSSGTLGKTRLFTRRQDKQILRNGHASSIATVPTDEPFRCWLDIYRSIAVACCCCFIHPASLNVRSIEKSHWQFKKTSYHIKPKWKRLLCIHRSISLTIIG